MPTTRLARAAALAALAGSLALAGCASDGRDLRPPRADQNQSILPADATSSTTTTRATTRATTASTSATSATTASAAGAAAGGSTSGAASGFAVTAPWAAGGAIPATSTCAGDNRSPAVSWTGVPAGTVEVAVTMIDLDLGGALHWLIAGLAPTTTSLAAGDVPAGAAQAVNLQGRASYTGPCPPPGSTHRYQLAVWALRSRSGVRPGSDAPTALAALERARLATATVEGTFSR